MLDSSSDEGAASEGAPRMGNRTDFFYSPTTIDPYQEITQMFYVDVIFRAMIMESFA